MYVTTTELTLLRLRIAMRVAQAELASRRRAGADCELATANVLHAMQLCYIWQRNVEAERKNRAECRPNLSVPAFS